MVKIVQENDQMFYLNIRLDNTFIYLKFCYLFAYFVAVATLGL